MMNMIMKINSFDDDDDDDDVEEEDEDEDDHEDNAKQRGREAPP